MRQHNCRHHIVIRRTVKPRHFHSGSLAKFQCKVCDKTVPLRMSKNQVLMRVVK